MCVYMCNHVKVKGELWGVSSFLPPHGLPGMVLRSAGLATGVLFHRIILPAPTS